MSSMVSTVLEIEREAEALLKKAADEAAQVIADAGKQRETATDEAARMVKKELQEIETKAKAEREKKMQELTASGEAALAQVRTISDDTFDAGVQHLLKKLSGE